MYSIYWADSNIKARTIVKTKPGIALFFDNKELCLHVKVAPLLNKTTVLNNGIPKGLIGLIPRGLHSIPTSILGDNALSKKAQKILKKNITSLKIKSIKLNFKASTKVLVWLPAILSRITVYLHIKIVKTKEKRLKSKPIKTPYLKKIINELIKAANWAEIHQG